MSKPTLTETLAAAAAVDTDLDVHGGPVDLLALTNLSFFVKNSGATALNACSLDSSADGTNWVVEDAATLATLGAGVTSQINVANNGRKFWRLRASVASSTTTLLIMVTGN
ncbi:MAG: hypothetical protein HOC74_10125 [Gemmatimonadetes bacterium]|jgi:hypothetical protein|nr:hypothetical protein [Gemmatimonadota bacterium]